MWRIVFAMFGFSLFVGLQGVASADESVGQIKAKLQAVQKQLQELQQQEQALLKQLDQATKEAVKRRESYVKAEVKGTLRHEVFSTGVLRWQGWTIAAGAFKWQLDFGKNNEFLKTAKENDGKVVVVTGKLVTYSAFPNDPFQTGFGQKTVIVVATFKVTEK